nr:PilX N-terminal domain-containing pilus assembly protein [Candidatus Thiodictyon syntrophicum]
MIVSLIVLLIMVILGVSGMRTSVLQELMAGHSKETNSAFQAAEAGTQTALTHLAALRVPPRIKERGASVAWTGTSFLIWAACEGQDFAKPATASFDPCATLNTVVAGWGSYVSGGAATLAGQAINAVSGSPLTGIGTTTQPHFIIESRYVPPLEPEKASARKGFHYFTVSAVGFDPGTNSRAILQTTITKLF